MFGKRLKELREERKMYQKDLAQVLGVSAGAIGMYENGKRTPDFDILKKIANFFDVSIDYLLGKSNERNLKKTTKKIDNADIRAISRAGEKMSPEEAQKLRQMAELLFPNAFKE